MNPEPFAWNLSSMSKKHSDLENIIPPEIRDDPFAAAIERIARTEEIQTVLEIGSSSGGGSTECFVKGLKANPKKPTLFCMEVSRTRFEALSNRYAQEGFVKCYNVSSVPLDRFASHSDVEKFYNQNKTGLNQYPLPQVLSWLDQDIGYVQEAGVPANGIELIKVENRIKNFDVVLIDGSEFTGRAELAAVHGARFIFLDDVNTYKNNENYSFLKRDSDYELVEENWTLRNGYALFKKKLNHLPVHFFTIVLNGKPFIEYHINEFSKLSCDWHWHIVEGVADLKHDTAWSLSSGGKINNELHRNGLSRDGTSEYIDELKAKYPDRISIYRKPNGQLWDGKREMISAPLESIKKEVLLWQLDCDELWTAPQIEKLQSMFLSEPRRTAAWFWCWYFVGPKKIISSRNCYAQNPNQEWLRAWRFKPGMLWASHEPPTLAALNNQEQYEDVGRQCPFLHAETEKAELIFQHLSYVTEAQVYFKESYYGYAGAVEKWRKLQTSTLDTVSLKDYFPWVSDETTVSSIEKVGIIPLLQLDQPKRTSLNETVIVETQSNTSGPIVIDGVFFQLNNTGIAKLWEALLREWSKTSVAKSLILLDRQGTAPKIPGINTITIPAYNQHNIAPDREMLQQACDYLKASLFISTYYSTPLTTPAVLMIYDMIPEVMQWDLSRDPQWADKARALKYASGYVCISESTKVDLLKFCPEINPARVFVSHPGIDHEVFYPASLHEIEIFKEKYNIKKPYLIMSGASINGYKNGRMLFEALAKLPDPTSFEVVVTGSNFIAADLATIQIRAVVHHLHLTRSEQRAAYGGAVALVFPSLYEGFGMPIVESMASGTVAIVTPFASHPEAAGEAALYVKNADEVARAINEVQNTKVRDALISAGLKRVGSFSWNRFSKEVWSAIQNLTAPVVYQKDTTTHSPSHVEASDR